MITAGLASHNVVIPIFDSIDPLLLAAIGPTGCSANLGRDCLFETGWGTSLPPGFTAQIFTLSWYNDPDAITWDPGRGGTSDGGSPGGLLIWARSPSLADLHAMLGLEPAYLGVNNIEEVRGLIDAP